MIKVEWETLKEKGNEEFKKKNYDEAIKYYTDAISNYLLNQRVMSLMKFSILIELCAIFHRRDTSSLCMILTKALRLILSVLRLSRGLLRFT